MRAACQAVRREGRRLALVPTMGALHEGHLSLVRAARSSCDVVAASIFVNPTQFGPNEDLAKYPRSFERDCELLEREGVELLFAPAVGEMYPAAADGSAGSTQDQNLADRACPELAEGSVRPTQNTWVTVEGLSDRLDGRSRPGHFRGVATIVAKLFNVIEPDIAFFGQKDAAQLAVIRRMVLDLNFPIEIVAGPIVRESDGLAMSSRNAYLNREERGRALVLHKSLSVVQQEFLAGERAAAKLTSAAKELFVGKPGVVLDYFEVVDPDTLNPVERISKNTLVAVAAHIGSTRLIDNVILEP